MSIYSCKCLSNVFYFQDLLPKLIKTFVLRPEVLFSLTNIYCIMEKQKSVLNCIYEDYFTSRPF